MLFDPILSYCWEARDDIQTGGPDTLQDPVIVFL